MNELSLYPIKVIAGLALLAWLAAGIYLFNNQGRIFAPDADAPGETSGARHYSRAQAWLVWLLMAKLFAFLAFAI